MKENKKGKTGPPAAGETPVLPKEDLPSLEDLLRGLGRRDGAGQGSPPIGKGNLPGSKGSAPGGIKGQARRVPEPVQPPSTTPPPAAPSQPTPSAPEPFTTAQKHVFERRPSYEQLEQPEVNYEQLERADTSYEQAPSADELAPGFERVPRYTNEAGEVDYEDPKRATYAGLDSRKPRFEPFEPEKQKVSPYAHLLRNAQAAREAFILSEIFRRKY